jgi:2-polyprenyl-3-methyl-5-hydroxy-6-metoxy-1,4-benzoquinol methylase
VIPPGKTKCIGITHPLAGSFEKLVTERFSLANAKNPEGFLQRVAGWASLAAYQRWLNAYRANAGNFLDHAAWGADRNLGGGHYLYGAMDDRYATNAARVFVAGGLNAVHVAGKACCVVGAWDGTECLLLRALGAVSVDAVEEVPVFCEMAKAQYEAWEIPGQVFSRSLYEIDIAASWQKYDLLYVPGVLYHLTDLPAALMILWSMLKPSGVLAFESISDKRGACTARYIGANIPGWNWWSPTPECFEAAMHDCGFLNGHTVEHAGGRGWWVGNRHESPAAMKCGAAGFSRPDILRTIARLQ